MSWPATKTTSNPISGESRRSIHFKDLAHEGGWESKPLDDGYLFEKDGRRMHVHVFIGTTWATGAILFEASNHPGVGLPPEEIKRVLFGERCICTNDYENPGDVTFDPTCPLVHREYM